MYNPVNNAPTNFVYSSGDVKGGWGGYGGANVGTGGFFSESPSMFPTFYDAFGEDDAATLKLPSGVFPTATDYDFQTVSTTLGSYTLVVDEIGRFSAATSSSHPQGAGVDVLSGGSKPTFSYISLNDKENQETFVMYIDPRTRAGESTKLLGKPSVYLKATGWIRLRWPVKNSLEILVDM